MSSDQQRPADPSANMFHRYHRASLEPMFHPRNIAVIGFADDPRNPGRQALSNLLGSDFGGKIFVVGAHISTATGVKSCVHLGEIGEPVDLAIIATSGEAVLEVLDDCAAAGVKGAVVFSSGFSEIGSAGQLREAKLLARAREANMRILGPNCSGLMMPHTGLNASIHHRMAQQGHVGFLSQSSSISAAILDWSFREKVGFSAFVSGGNMSDIDWSDLIYYLGDDPHTHSIVIYLQSLRDARSFLSAVREIALSKPIIVLKSDQTTSGAAAHELPFRPEDLLNAAFRRTGVLAVESLVDLFAMSEILSKQPPAKGRRLIIVTNAGGAGAQARKKLLSGGGKLAVLSAQTVAALKENLPESWRPGNPIHLLRDAGAERYEKTLNVIAKSPESDGILVVLAPHAQAEPTQTAEKLGAFAKLSGKPILASWMGGDEVAEGKTILNAMHIPTFSFPDTAAQIFNYMWQYTYNLRGLFETPNLPTGRQEDIPHRQKVVEILSRHRQSGQLILSSREAKAVLKAYEIPVSPLERVSRPYRLALGSHTDPLFGPVLYCGSGGTVGRIYPDTAVALPPLNSTLARRMMEQTRIYTALRGEKGFEPVNMNLFEHVLIRFSQLIIEQTWIKEIEINPLLISQGGIRMENIRMVLHDPDLPPEQLPRPAIRPYPIQYVRPDTLRDGSAITIRPIRPEDEPLLVKFHENLSDHSVYLRYFYPLNLQQRISHERLARICFIDYDREMVLVVEKKDKKRAEREIIAVGRLNKLRGANDAEFAITISDAYQNMGLGTKLLSMLVEIGRDEGVARIIADILPENQGMQRVSKKVGFELHYDPGEQVVKAVLPLQRD